MPRFDSRLQRLFLRLPLRAGGRIEVTREQANYLLNVLRMETGSEILVFNGQDGEWLARIADAGRRACVLEFVERVRAQEPSADLHYLFAPLKMARLDYMVQKAVELGVGLLRPVITRHTQVGRVNLERMESNAVEAAEQCGILAIPKILEPVELKALLDVWPGAEPNRRIFFCDENETTTNPLAVLGTLPKGPAAVLVGPEGGFAEEERLILKSKPFVTAIPLGPRVLRADTAAVAALAVVQATVGDW
ncbi:16S rRNA (uracil(1498)-N(3))-methyltransferase [Prosthecomicrobium sp. N25]|uniref:16S rRNA (uracil(1498)-N(3))-methyltransferase n=1 Tax=Prosthecomicrobium sp. N25 TaxID=3129254 RepID=UPI003076E1C7